MRRELSKDTHLVWFCQNAILFCTAPVCNETAIRLVGGPTPNQGRVEICLNGAWGTVCDDDFGSSEAMVICRQLGYTDLEHSVPFIRAFFGQGLVPIHLDDLNCLGTEAKLADCDHSGIGNHNCGNSEDAGVLCVPGMIST